MRRSTWRTRDDADVRSLDRPDARIAFDVVGDGPTVLLSHGFCATSAMFTGNLPALSREHRVVTWDLRGHGASDSPADQDAYTADGSVADMAALLDAVDAETAVVGGHSLGGFLSLRFVLTHPDRVRGLVLIDTGPGFRNAEARDSWNSFAETYAAGLEEKGLAGLPAGEELHADAHRDAAGLVRAARGILVQNDSMVIDGLASIAVPTLVIVGSEDKGFIAGSEYMARKIPVAHLVVIDGAGHAPNVTHTAEFDDTLLDFLGSLPAR